MSPAPRSNTVTIRVVALAFAAMLVIATLELIVIIQHKLPTLASLTTTAPIIALLPITALPTIDHAPSTALPPLPAVTAASQIDSYPSTLAAISVQPAVPVSISGPLTDPNLNPHVGPVAVPLNVQIPSLNVEAPVVGVGLTLANAMASPIGTPDDPIWQTVFWYRGGAIPGDVGTATLAGHVDDSLGRPAVFAHLDKIRIGDVIVVHDTQSNVDIPFIVTETQTYSDKQATDPSVLARIFGSAAISSTGMQPVSDGLAHLTLITCAGAWFDGSFDMHLVVYASRASYPSVLAG